MKHLKLYEESSSLPKVGDYANIKGTSNIGVINDINYRDDSNHIYVIEYYDFVLDSKLDVWKSDDGGYEYNAYLHEINFSNLKEELELLIQTNKYNL